MSLYKKHMSHKLNSDSIYQGRKSTVREQNTIGTQEGREGENNRGQEKESSYNKPIRSYLPCVYKHCCTSLNTHCWCFGKGEQIKLEKRQGRYTPCHVK